jgi:hypothetical protein
MMYSQMPDWVRDIAGAMDEEMADRSLHYGGLILYPETAQAGLIEPIQLLEQIDAARAGGCDGIILFAGQHLFSQPWTPDDRLLLTLREGPFREPAESQHTSWKQRPLTRDATVPYLYAVATPSVRIVQIAAGQTASLSVAVKNSGTEPFEVTGANISSPIGWQVKADPPTRRNIQPGEEAVLPLMLHAPTDAEPGQALARMGITVRAGAMDKSVAVPGIQVTVEAAEEAAWGEDGNSGVSRAWGSCCTATAVRCTRRW